MVARIVLGFMVMMFVLIQTANAEGTDKIQKYFNDTASKVKATTDPAEKRAILEQSFQTMSKALDKVQSSPLISKEDRAEAVKQYIIANSNIMASQIEAIGYGESKPIAPNETVAGRASNRRVDVVIHPYAGIEVVLLK